MYFDFEDRLLETPTVESGMSWRERTLLSLFTHLVFVALVVFVPRMDFMREAAERRAEQLAAMVEEQQLARVQEERPEFMFIEPFVDTPAPEAPAEAYLSDIDRVAQSSLQAESPQNDLPNADGNSSEFVETEEVSNGRELDSDAGEELESPEGEALESVDGVEDGAEDPPAPAPPDATPGDGGALENPFLADRGEPSRETPPTTRPGQILNQALRGLSGVSRPDTFRNLVGETDRYGSDIQFDSKGVDFGSWIRRFRAQIYRNWFIPQAAMSMSGNVMLTFNVHTDGSLTALAVERPARVEAFTNSAFNAILGSNPTAPLPSEYPDDQVLFTVTFYFNVRPPGR